MAQLQNFCAGCQKPFFANYDLAGADSALTHEALAIREKTWWRYHEVLPLALHGRPTFQLRDFQPTTNLEF